MNWWRLLFYISLCKPPEDCEKISYKEGLKREWKTLRFKIQLSVVVIPFLCFLFTIATGGNWTIPFIFVFVGIFISVVMDIVKNVRN